jgi:hypothetical protein
MYSDVACKTRNGNTEQKCSTEQRSRNMNAKKVEPQVYDVQRTGSESVHASACTKAQAAAQQRCSVML